MTTNIESLKKMLNDSVIQMALTILLLLLVTQYFSDSQSASAFCGSRYSKYNTAGREYDTTFTNNWTWYCGNYQKNCVDFYGTQKCETIKTVVTETVPFDYLNYYRWRA